MEAITVYTLGSRLLKNGSTGADVKALQELLNQLGAALDVDGQFGSKTESAVKAFQKKAGIKQDGKYGYKLEHQGRTNKKNQQVRDLVIDETEQPSGAEQASGRSSTTRSTSGFTTCRECSPSRLTI